MGMNYYLQKKDKGTWTVPVGRLGAYVENLCVKVSEQNPDEALALDLEKCISKETKLHIGKSSMGWNFSLCIYPSLNIYNLDDWKKLFNSDEYTILNEEDKEVPAEKMLETISCRKSYKYENFKSEDEYEKHCIECANNFEEKFSTNKGKHYNSYDEYLKENNAVRGKNGLLAHITSIWDERDNNVWKDFPPMIIVYIPTEGTYDLTPDWDFS